VLSIADNHFSQFHLPVEYDIDLPRLDSEFRQFQQLVHPDRHAAASDEQRLLAIKLSSHLNEAYQTLKSPLRRAAYLLRLQGVDVEQVEQSDLAPELLLEQMQLREQLAELPQDESAFAALEQMGDETSERLVGRQRDFAALLASGALAEARKLFHELQFLSKLQAEIEKAEDALFAE